MEFTYRDNMEKELKKMCKNFPNKMGWPDAVIEKIWDRVKYPEEFNKTTDKSQICFEWEGLFNKFGQPIFRFNGKYELAKRIVYQSFFGPIEEGKVISNICKHKKCVRPDHLQQNYYFLEIVNARGGQKDPNDRRKNMKIKVTEKEMLRVFNSIKTRRLKSIEEVGRYLNIDDNDVVEFITNDDWEYINKYYRKIDLDKLRKMLGLINV